MTLKDYTFFSYNFSATAFILLLIGHAHGAGLCDDSPNKKICYSIVYNRTDPREASIAAVHKLVYQTKVAKVVAERQARSDEIANCISKFDGAIGDLKYALYALGVGDYTTLRNYIIEARTGYLECDDRYRIANTTNPIAKSTKFLIDITFVGAYLATLIK